MNLEELIKILALKVKSGGENLAKEITGGYCGDLLSDVMANSKAGSIWITMQVHLNIVAIASLKEHAAIILVNNREPNEDTLKKAIEEKISILTSELTAFELAGKLYALGIGKSE